MSAQQIGYRLLLTGSSVTRNGHSPCYGPANCRTAGWEQGARDATAGLKAGRTKQKAASIARTTTFAITTYFPSRPPVADTDNRPLNNL